MADKSSFEAKIQSGNHSTNLPDLEASGGGYENDKYALNGFLKEVDNVKEDIKQMELLYNSLHESNGEIKEAISAKALMELQARTKLNMDNVLKLAKRIDKKMDGLVRTNASQRKVLGNEPGSPDDKARTFGLSELGESITEIKGKFQGLRVRMETDHKQVIESRYLIITGEKATEEAIDNLISTTKIDDMLEKAIQDYGRGAVLDMVTEIQERRDAMKDIRRSLMNLHQILLGMASPAVVDAQQGRKGGGVGHSGLIHVDPLTGFTGKAGPGPLNDYEKETRSQAYIALGIAFLVSIVVIVMYVKCDSLVDQKPG